MAIAKRALRIEDGPMQRAVPLRAALAILLLIALVGSTVVLFVPEYRVAFNVHLTGLLESVRQLDAWGPVVVGAAYIPSCLFFLPGSLLTLFGGFAFGGTFREMAVVTACVSAGSTLGASAAFIVGRTVARQWIETRVATNTQFRAIDAAVGENGFKIVLLTRLSPVFPFNLLNYAFGLTRVSFHDYFFASWIGMLPGTILYIYLGSTAGTLANIVAGKVEKSLAQQFLFYAGLVATIAVTVSIARLAKRALAEALPDDTE